jgi:hypothetical protein
MSIVNLCQSMSKRTSVLIYMRMHRHCIDVCLEARWNMGYVCIVLTYILFKDRDEDMLLMLLIHLLVSHMDSRNLDPSNA